ncbi:MAG: hypothetical protein WDN48_07955 [Pseudolabrys sp.]
MTIRNTTIAGVLGLLGLSLLGCTSALAADRTGALPAQAMAAEITACRDRRPRVGGDDKQTRFVVDLTQKIDVAAFALANPYAWSSICRRSPSGCRRRRASRAAAWSRPSATA